MDITHSLLVAMMFVILLSLGIGNILMGLAALLQHRIELKTNWLPTSWHVLVLLEIFDLFWHTLSILNVETWDFAGFVYITTGPILLFLATSLMLPALAGDESGDSLTQYFNVARGFFAILAVYMLWLIGVDFVITEDGFSATHGWVALEAVLLVVLAVSRQHRVHSVITAVFWILLLSLMAVRATGTVA